MGRRVWSAAASLVAVLLLSGSPVAASDLVEPNAANVTFTSGFAGPVWYGSTTTWHLNVNNPTSSAVKWISFSTTLPSGMTTTAATKAVCGGTVTTTSTKLALSGGQLPAGTNCQVLITVKMDHAAHYVMKNDGAGYYQGQDVFVLAWSSAVDVLSPPALSYKFASPTIGKGSTTTLTVTVQNPSENAIDLPSVAATISFGSGISATAGTFTVCGGTMTVASSHIALSGATVKHGASCVQAVTITGTALGSYAAISSGATSTLSSGKTGTGSNTVATLTVAGAIGPPAMATPTPTPAAGHTQAPGGQSQATASAAPTSTDNAIPSAAPSESASPDDSASESPSPDASASGDLLAAASIEASPSGSQGIADATSAASVAASGATANGSAAGGDSSWLLLLAALAAVVAGGGFGLFTYRRRRASQVAAVSGETPKE